MKKIIIYGAGRIGRRVFASLKEFGLKIEFFWDKNAEIVPLLNDVKILEPDVLSIPFDIRSEYQIIVTISAPSVNQQIGESLRKLGYNAIYERDIIDSIIYSACWRQQDAGRFQFDLRVCYNCPVPKDSLDCNLFRSRITADLASGVHLSDNKTERLIIPKLGLLVSNKCNLNCKGCNHLIDLYRPGDFREFVPDDLIGDLEKVVLVSDLVYQVVVVGGESFIHPRLYEILQRIMELPKIGFIQIITNGSVKIKDERLFSLMANKRIMVEISGYGNNLSQVLNDNVQNFIAKLKQHNIAYNYMNTLQWFDFGTFEKRAYSREKHLNIFQNCCSVSNDIFNGRLYKCSRSALATFLEKIPDYPEDYVDVRKYSGLELRLKLIKFFKNKYPSACLHCSGASEVIEAGVQVPRNRK